MPTQEIDPKKIDPKLAGYVEQAKADAAHAFAFLREGRGSPGRPS